MAHKASKDELVGLTITGVDFDAFPDGFVGIAETPTFRMNDGSILHFMLHTCKPSKYYGIDIFKSGGSRSSHEQSDLTTRSSSRSCGQPALQPDLPIVYMPLSGDSAVCVEELTTPTHGKREYILSLVMSDFDKSQMMDEVTYAIKIHERSGCNIKVIDLNGTGWSFECIIKSVADIRGVVSIWLKPIPTKSVSEYIDIFKRVNLSLNRALSFAPDKSQSQSRIEFAGDLIRYLYSTSHKRLVDKHDKPLLDHCMRVYVACIGLSEEQRIVAMLHDTIEDGLLSRELINWLFGGRIGQMVEDLTRSRYIAPGETYSTYIDGIVQSQFARLIIPIKLADLNDNLDRTRGPIPDSLRNRYRKAYHRLSRAMRWFDNE